MGVLDEIKAILSPAGAWLWAELDKNNRCDNLENTDVGLFLLFNCIDNLHLRFKFNAGR